MESTETPPKPGQTVPLHVAPSQLHWFDPASTQRV
jgi:hypothetical protein